MTKVRLFMSFDLDHDRDLHDLLLEQARRGSTFSIADRSEGGEITDQWVDRARGRIAGSSEVVVICGEHTDESPRVSAELRIAQEEHIPYLLLWGRRDRMCKKPKGAKADDGMYSWTLEILQHQLLTALRRNQASEVPESMKRRATAARS